MITDSGMLMGEVFQSSRRSDGSRGGRITSLLWALVDVPPGWALDDPRVRALAGRHLTDLPAAQLAVTIGGCFLLSEDPDLYKIPNLGFYGWLEVAHAAANQTEVEAIYVTASIPFNVVEATAGAAYRRIAAASTGAKWALAGLAAIIVIGGIWWVRSGRAGTFFERAKPVIKELGETYGPPLMETMKRYNLGQVIMARAVVPRADGQALGERIARVLAYSSGPLLAGDIARGLETPGNLRDRTQLIRAELQGCEAFTEVSQGRWVLGRASGHPRAQLPLDEVADYMDRVHKDTRRAWRPRAPGADQQPA
jgi:hypothetical protein